MGGVICGNCAMDRFFKETRPTTTITMDRTDARMGRSIKKWEVMAPFPDLSRKVRLRRSCRFRKGRRLLAPLAEFDEILPPPLVRLTEDPLQSATLSRAMWWLEPGEAPLCLLYRSHRQTAPWDSAEWPAAG